MPDTTGGTQLTVLGDAGSADDDALPTFYRYPANLQSCWVRGNMIASLDGGATDADRSGGLGGPGDRAVFTQMRNAADVILVGAGTVRTENYSGAQPSVAARRDRQRRGQPEVPPIAVLTRTAQLDPTSRFFTSTSVSPLILTAASTVEDARHRLGAVAEVLDASGAYPAAVDLGRALTILAQRRLFRVLAEGGPSLLGELIETGRLDELCLTVAPVLVAGSAPRIATGPGQVHTRMHRTHVLGDDDGYLYLRYARSV